MRLGLIFLLFFGIAGAASLERQTWAVDGVAREALVHVPDKIPDGGAPVVFVFHGRGGSMRQASRNMPIHAQWPEAIVVYPQGLPTAGELTDPGGRETGWQTRAGAWGDRDLRFFDILLADLRARHAIDQRRIYATGHSNGGAFTYLLWAERGDVFAALAPSAAVLARGEGKLRQLRPKPIFHVASPADPLVQFAWQERMLDYVLRLNGCGKLLPDAMGCTRYPSDSGCDVEVYLHDGGHQYPSATAPELIVKFFQAHPAR
jgi:polyhydroxybutyrate depolymerase